MALGVSPQQRCSCRAFSQELPVTVSPSLLGGVGGTALSAPECTSDVHLLPATRALKMASHTDKFISLN